MVSPLPTKFSWGTKLTNREGSPWAADDNKQLKECFQDGYGIDQIANLLHRTPSAIVSRLVRLGLLAQMGRRYYKVVGPVVTFDELKRMQEVYLSKEQ